MRRGTTAWGLLGALLGSLGACQAELSADDLRDAIAQWFGRAEGISVDAVRCERGLPRTPGPAVECAVILGTQTVEVTVQVVDDDGALSVRPRHTTLVASRAELEIGRTLRDQGIDVAEVECEGPVWVARPGSGHRCEVRATDGRRFEWRGVWSGDGARQRTTVTPLPPLPPPAVDAGAREGESPP
ncbi:DUF4333 domain-containing protein [Paraliomyxa miuraensis]|uniref:DUF4333 domain-containing protein n=1 Tax=Paraliomyxa miuraensis TaxID=376150 RepID=UPI0022521774|nr:DUF4333 domain-containing protein [Paraliomyxa miuraensis]MCX4245627.1 DUF4333 domain-containing protein [Paraliomyxa miuraensis]